MSDASDFPVNEYCESCGVVINSCADNCDECHAANQIRWQRMLSVDAVESAAYARGFAAGLETAAKLLADAAVDLERVKARTEVFWLRSYADVLRGMIAESKDQ